VGPPATGSLGGGGPAPIPATTSASHAKITWDIVQILLDT